MRATMDESDARAAEARLRIGAKAEAETEAWEEAIHCFFLLPTADAADFCCGLLLLSVSPDCTRCTSAAYARISSLKLA